MVRAAAKLLVIAIYMLTVAGCSNTEIRIVDERTPHFHRVANIGYDGDQEIEFDIRKRPDNIVVEHELYKGTGVNASVIAGKHRDYRWMSGVLLQYSF